MHLSKRLEACLKYTEGFVKLADIGTDHAMLPIVAVQRGNVVSALAIDNKFGPFLAARTNIIKYNVTDKVKVLLGDGLEKIDDETDVVVISGMGGELIVTILTSFSLRNVKRFILQSNNNVPLIRQLLPEIGFYIVDELVLEDQKKLYEVLVIEKGHQQLTPLEIEFGPINVIQKPYYFLKKITREVEHLTSIVGNIEQPDEKLRIKNRINVLQEVANERNEI